MKLCRYGDAGAERPGLVDGDGNLRDLSGVVADIDAAVLSEHGLARLAAVAPDSLPLVAGNPRLGVPFSGLTKYICIGLNYTDHAQEAGLDDPDEPVIFLKAPSALCGACDDMLKPQHASKLDWEVELAVVIGKVGRSIAQEDAFDHVAGYCLVDDVSERAFQMQSSQWDKGKSLDSFGPVGPWLVTKDEVPDPQQLSLWLDVNGQRRQNGTTANMIFPVRHLVSYVSRYMTLLPGDLIATGTPAGVGMGAKPTAVYLQAGDVITLGGDGLGMQRHVVVATE